MKGVPPPIVPLSDRLHDTRTPLLLKISRGLPLECHEWPEDVPNITQCLLRHLHRIHRHTCIIHKDYRPRVFAFLFTGLFTT